MELLIFFSILPFATALFLKKKPVTAVAVVVF